MVAKRERWCWRWSVLGLRFLVDAAVSFSVAALEAALALLLVALAMGAQRTPDRQTVSSHSLSLSLSLARGKALFFFLNFKYLNNKQTNNSRFLLSGVRDVTLPSPGARKWKFPWQKSSNISQSRALLVECSWLYRAHGRRRSSTTKKRDDGGGSSDSVGGHGRRQSGGSAFTPEGLPPGSYLRLLVAPRRASVRRL